MLPTAAAKSCGWLPTCIGYVRPVPNPRKPSIPFSNMQTESNITKRWERETSKPVSGGSRSGNAAAGGAAPLALDLDARCELWELISGYSSLVCDQLIFHLQNSSRELSLAFLEIKVDMQGVHVEVCFGSLGLHKVNRDDELIF